MAKAKSQNQPSSNSAFGFAATLWAEAGQRAELAAALAALRAEFALPNVAEIIGKFGGTNSATP